MHGGTQPRTVGRRGTGRPADVDWRREAAGATSTIGTPARRSTACVLTACGGTCRGVQARGSTFLRFSSRASIGTLTLKGGMLLVVGDVAA